MGVCAGCGNEDRIWRDQRCFACNLAAQVDALLAGSDDWVLGELAPLRAAIAGATSPRAALRWLGNPGVQVILAGLARSELPLDHSTLDQLAGDGRWVARRRQVFVSSGVLPTCDETVAPLEAWLEHQLQRVEDAEDRPLVSTYANWWVLRRCTYGRHTR